MSSNLIPVRLFSRVLSLIFSDIQHLCVTLSTSPLLSSWPLNWIIRRRTADKRANPPTGNLIPYFVVYATTCTVRDAWYVGLMLFIPSWLETGSAAVLISYPLQRVHSFHHGMMRNGEAHWNNLDTCLNAYRCTRPPLCKEDQSICAIMLSSV